jgi:hypothetical protein
VSDKKDPDELLRERWSKASRLTLSGAGALFLLTRGAKSGAGKILEIFGLDWSSLNPHAVALFGVPVVAGLYVWSLWWARAYAHRQSGAGWVAKVVTASNIALIPERAPTAAIWSLLLFVALPLIGLAALEGTFLHGIFYYATDGGFSCPQNCKEEVGVLAHFWPANGFPDLLDTPYRYIGNLTYVPVVQPILWLLFGFGALFYAAFYLRLIFQRSIPGLVPAAEPVA